MAALYYLERAEDIGNRVTYGIFGNIEIGPDEREYKNAPIDDVLSVKPGDFVQVSLRSHCGRFAELMWLIVKKPAEKNGYGVGELDNNPRFLLDVKRGVDVKYEVENVTKVLGRDENLMV